MTKTPIAGQCEILRESGAEALLCWQREIWSKDAFLAIYGRDARTKEA